MLLINYLQLQSHYDRTASVPRDLNRKLALDFSGNLVRDFSGKLACNLCVILLSLNLLAQE